MVFYSFPVDSLSENEKEILASIMDQSYEEGFFTHKVGILTSMNYYFEIPSQWARGSKEMVMISIVLNFTPTSATEAIILSWCIDFATRLKSNEEIYKSFYSPEDSQVSQTDFQDIKKFNENLKFWVRELYWMVIEELREKSEEEKWATLLSQTNIFKVIKKLSKGPLGLEDLTKWYNHLFNDHQLAKIIETLEQEKILFVNTIGQETYVLLVKDVNVLRVPPNCIIDLQEDSPELGDLTEVYINEVRDFFENYQPTLMDSLELFKLFSNSKIYNVISQLREGPLPKEKIFSMVSEKTTKTLMQNIESLKEKNIIQEFTYKGEILYMLKTDVVFTATFPIYLKEILPKESKGHVAQSYTTKKKNEEGMLESETETIPSEDEESFTNNNEDDKNTPMESGSEVPKLTRYSLTEESKMEFLDTEETTTEDEKLTPDQQKRISDQLKMLIDGEKTNDKQPQNKTK